MENVVLCSPKILRSPCRDDVLNLNAPQDSYLFFISFASFSLMSPWSLRVAQSCGAEPDESHYSLSSILTLENKNKKIENALLCV